MEHIRQFDWCYPSQPDIYFLREEDFEHSVTEKILRNKFHDPLLSSDSDNDGPAVDWEKVFSTKQNGEKGRRLYVPGIRSVPQYPKLSAINRQQQYQCVKVLSYQNPHILETEFMPRPTKSDYKLFDELKEIYEKEQKEFKEWARTLWTSSHCIRALRPKPLVETVYEARFKMCANEFISYPNKYDMAAQIPLQSGDVCEMVHMKDLINVNINELPQIKCEPLTKQRSILQQCSIPEPCNKHHFRFILPKEKSVTELPLTGVQRALAEYAAENSAHYIASESALKCLSELDQPWQIPVSVFEIVGPDGEARNITVLGNDFTTRRESVLRRTYRAFKILLEYTSIPPSEKTKIIQRNAERNAQGGNYLNRGTTNSDSSDDEDGLLIDENELEMDTTESEPLEINDKIQNHDEGITTTPAQQSTGVSPAGGGEGGRHCTCRETYFEMPPPRSFKKWRLKNRSNEEYDIIVHCAHSVRDDNDEVLLEPIPEYQLDLGASEPTQDRWRSLLLALRLRNCSTLLSVRVDNCTGDIVSYERTTREELARRHELLQAEAANRVHSTCSQLQGLRPGHYILKHEPNHGVNAMLYVAKDSAKDLLLDFQTPQQPEADDARDLKNAPTLAPILLPVHKFRKIMPCAFSPYENESKPPRVQPSRQKTPPQALKWPKKKKKKKSKT